MNGGGIGADAASAAKHLILSNAFQKICTFSLNQVMLRYSGPEVFGLASIELELLLSTLLFLSREGIRLAVLQSKGDDMDQLRTVVHLSILPALVVCVISGVVLYWYSVHRPAVDFAVIVMYCLGALLETCAEPLYNLYYSRLIMLPRLRAEMVAVTCRSLSTFVIVVLFGAGIRGFGAAQMIYGAVYFAVMAAHTPLLIVSGKVLGLRDITGVINIFSMLSLFRSDKGGRHELLTLAGHATCSSLLKHILTEGDKIVLSVSASHFNQGVYAITSNYGSLVARIFFQPIEESCRVAFSRMSSAGGSELRCRVANFSLLDWKNKMDYDTEVSISPPGPEGGATGGVQTRSHVKGPQTEDAGNNADSRCAAIESMTELFTAVLSGIILFSLIFPVVGAYYSRAAVKLFLGPSWYSDETVETLSCFCFYIFVISINGIAESFVHAVISPKSLLTFNFSLVVSWVFFMGSSVPLMSSFGTPGLVVANTVGMILRAAFNLYFVQSFVIYAGGSSSIAARNLISRVAPPVQLILVCLVLSAVCSLSASYFFHSTMRPIDYGYHIGAGGVCGVLYILTVWVYCRYNVMKAVRSVRGPRVESHHD